uniref:Cell division protein FtsL n=1 Tax=uncultured Bacteroidota bacterium TaxID=152509 RepID=H5SIF5_9BACT|nr:hypothetical protein HGMM_F32H02C14 [uncultured Bacteroidetes bacterium]
MIGLALIVGMVLLYRAYKLRLKHSAYVQQLEKENAQLRAELRELKARYETALVAPEREKTPFPQRRIKELAHRLRKLEEEGLGELLPGSSEESFPRTYERSRLRS